MDTKTKPTRKTTTRLAANPTVRAVAKAGSLTKAEKDEHARKGGKALMEAWRRIAERNGEGYER